MSPARQTGFFFDPVYFDFLEEVARRTPAGATVVVFAPRYPDLFRYQAVYRLVPRRVVEAEQAGEAQFVAAYGSENVRPGGTPLPNGTLLRK